MTQEEKARAYDEALNRAKAAIDIAADKDLVKSVVTAIFPLLREGQENNVIDIPFGAHDSELKGWEYTIPEGFTAEIKDGKVIVREKESEDEKIRRQLINVCNDWLNGDYSARPCLNDIKWLKNLLEKQKEQKPAERVEINKSLTEAVIAELSKYNGENHCKSPWAIDSTGLQYPLYFANLGATWQKEQNPAVWGEEDEKTIDDAYCWLCEYAGSLIQKNYEKSSMLYGIAEKFKSLRPQYHGDVTMTEAYKMGLEAGKASSWKPSEEQMQCLLAVITNQYNAGAESCHLTLGSLYNDLKKLI